VSLRLGLLLAANGLLSGLVVARFLALQDAWERQDHAIAVHARSGAP
jgi:hypothetical protein